MKKTKVNYTAKLFFIIPLTALALYIFHILLGYNNSEGAPHIAYTKAYPLILFLEYAFTASLFIPLIMKAKDKGEAPVYIFPLMLFSALGMMRIDSATDMKSSDADFGPSIMFLILFAALILMFLSGHPIAGAVGTVAGTAAFPVFGLAFSPFIAAAAFFSECKNEKEKKISVLINCLLSISAIVFCILKTEISEFSFSKEYIPVFILVTAAAVFFTVTKEYRLITLSILPLFPLLSGILFGAFPTEFFTLAGSVAPFAVLLGICSLFGDNKKITGYAQKITHNPAIYIIVAVFILHTAGLFFYNPGFFRDRYI